MGINDKYLANRYKQSGATLAGITGDIADSCIYGKIYDAGQPLAELLADGYTGSRTDDTAGKTFTAQCSDGQYQISVGADGQTLTRSNADAAELSATAAALPLAVGTGTFTEPTTLIYLGASITNGMVSGFETTIATYLAYSGLSVTVVDSAVGGDEIEDISTRWESIKATYAGNPAVYVFLHGGGNNTSNTRPYATATAGEIAKIKSDYATLVSSILENGNTLIPASVTYRAYPVMANENEGSLPYNENIFKPILNAMRTEYPHTCAPLLDLYRYTQAYYPAIGGGDGVHYSGNGYDTLRYLVADNVVNVYKSGAPVSFVGDAVTG